MYDGLICFILALVFIWWLAKMTSMWTAGANLTMIPIYHAVKMENPSYSITA